MKITKLLVMIVILSFATPALAEGDTASVTISVLGLPASLSTRIYLNGTNPIQNGRPLTVSSASPVTAIFARNSTISITVDSQLSDSLGNIFTLSYIRLDGNKSDIIITIKLDRDVQLTAEYDWTHILLSPLLWPFYALLLLLLVHRWLTMKIRKGLPSTSKTESTD